MDIDTRTHESIQLRSPLLSRIDANTAYNSVIIFLIYSFKFFILEIL
jgi:hypothetical protein